MELNIKFSIGGSVFGDSHETRGMEATKIMGKIGARLRDGHTEGLCTDSFGNTVGSWEVVDD